jgi:hypothetical protein
MSTVDPPPRPTVAAARQPAWTRTVPSIQGRELWVWRAATVALLLLAALGTLMGSPGSAALALLMVGPAALVAESRANWWVRRR